MLIAKFDDPISWMQRPYAVYALYLPAERDAEIDIDYPHMKVRFIQFSKGGIPTIIGYHSWDGVWWCNDPAKYDAARPWTPDTMEEAVNAWKRYRANGWREVL